jgi:hypothetical protein
MSTLKADTIQSTGGGAATLTKQSAPKAHTQLDQTGTTELKGSFNFSSVTDVGTGLADLFFTNNFSANSYANPGSADGGGGTQAVVDSWHNVGNAYRSTAANSIGVRNINDNTFVDREFTVLIYCGDLA